MKDRIDPKEITFTEEPMSPVRVRAFCDCGQGGELRSEGGGLFGSAGSRWFHKCQKCGAEVLLDKTYPRIDYKPAE